MKRISLGQSGITVPDMCLGTMTWGTQTPESDAHRQIDMALEAGIDFIDTATMYPVNPVRPETLGGTEKLIGNWIASPGRRDRAKLATKHVGEGSRIIPGGSPKISSATIVASVEASLRRMKTDMIDLYQFHWPNRGSYMFRKNWTFDPRGQDKAETLANMEDCLGALQDLVTQGKIRAFGMSNDSAWGTAMWLKTAEACGGPPVVSLQNEYSLLGRLYDTDLAELAVHEDITLLAFSPLACGYLTGKYQDDNGPEGSRLSMNGTMGGRETARVRPAAAAYLDVAARHGIDPVHMALAFCRQRPFKTSAIFGATTTAQLEHILAGCDVVLDDAVLADIDTAHRAHPMPY